MRLLASGPRAGFFEIIIPHDGISSSIMPGKVNPTQVEVLTMVTAQVIGNNTTITTAGASGQLELNVFKPVIIYNLLQSIRLLGDACSSFADHFIARISANAEFLGQQVNSSLMQVTALSPHIGYDAAVQIAKQAFDHNLTLKQASIELKLVSAEDFDRWVNPVEMLGPRASK